MNNEKFAAAILSDNSPTTKPIGLSAPSDNQQQAKAFVSCGSAALASIQLFFRRA
jgi:hypothetical protein